MCAEPFGRNPLEAASRSASESRFAHGHKNECGRDLRVPKTGRDLVVRQVDVGLCVARKLRAGDARPPQRDVLRRIKKLAESLEPIAKIRRNVCFVLASRSRLLPREGYRRTSAQNEL